jgi:hypothetical protein
MTSTTNGESPSVKSDEKNEPKATPQEIVKEID